MRAVTHSEAMVVSDGYPLPMLRDPPRHPLLEKCTFEQLHRNEVIETKPHVLHFGGFTIHKEHSQVLRVINTSPSSLRISIIGPSTAFFRIQYDKKGLLAPGMSEDVTVLFEPHEWRYYYDTVKIFCGDLAENLVVPIHAYPSANDIALPRLIDFGSVAIGATKSKRIPLSCKIPIRFEYEITIVENHPDFDVSPLSGDIPPDGLSEVVITFAPTRHRTARMELHFSISQFNFEPVTVSIVGSSAPDITRDLALKSASAELAASETEFKQHRTAGAVAVLGARRKRGPLEVRPPAFAAEETERVVDGVKVSTVRFDPQSAGYVLGQKNGKLPLKDLFSFIREQRSGLETLKCEQEAKVKAAGGTDAARGLADMSAEADKEDKQALELRFEMHYRDVDKFDRDKELRSMPSPGEERPSDQDVQSVREARAQRHAALIARRMASDMSRSESVVGNSKVPVPSIYRPVVQPQWDKNANDTFSVRLQVIDRFLRACSKLMMQLRAQRRSQRLRQAMRAAGVTDRASCRAWVEEETKAAASGAKRQAGKPNSAKAPASGLAALVEDAAVAEVLDIVGIPEDFVLPMCLPTAQAGMTVEERQPVEVEPLGNFDVFKPVQVQARLDFKVLDYKRYSVPPAAAYMRPHSDAPRLRGALEEQSVRGPLGSALDGAEEPLAMPESCLLPPAHDAMALLVPSGQCRSYIALPECAECDPEYRLAQAPPLLLPMQTPALLPRGIETLERPWLSVWRPVRHLPDAFQNLDVAPPCFAEVGGPYAWRLGCDLSGERMRMLPVGGFDRDLPSDTDDDECGEFVLPPPSDESFAEAVRQLGSSLTSDRWSKEAVAEERLKASCAKDSKAVRERLVQLNHDLQRSSKLFLG